MPEGSSGSISRIVSGSTIVFGGVILHKIIAFGGSVFNARLLGSTGYGVIVVALSLFFLLGNFLTLGLNGGIARNYSRVDSESTRRSILVTAYRLGIAAAAIGAVAVFVSARPLAVHVFGDGSIAPVLRILAVAIPLKVLLNLANGTLQAVKKPLIKTVVTSILRPVVRIVLIVALVLSGYGAAGVAGAYLTATALAAIVSLYYVHRHTELFHFGQEATPSYRSLLRFSLPLVGSSILLKFMNNLDTLLIASFMTSAAVGGYNVAFVLGQTTLLFIESVGFMYMPELSDLYKEGSIDHAGELYRAVTKWLVFLSLPFILVALIFPRYVLTFIYSSAYAYATIPFIILVVGFLSHILNGPNRNTLIAFDETRLLFLFDAGAVLANLVLNLALIPAFGIAGAAIATGTSYMVRNTMMTWYLNRAYGYLPFSWSLFLPTIPLVITAGVIGLVVREPSFIVVVASTVLLVSVMVVGYLSSGIEEADLLLADLLEDAGLDLSIPRKLHRKMN